MDHVLCLRNIMFCPPSAAPPPLRADCIGDGYDYDELPVSEPPRVQPGLSKGGAPPGAGGEATGAAGQVVAAPAPAPDGGVGGAAWLAQFFASVYGKVAGTFRS